jgi:hypothetical protein
MPSERAGPPCVPRSIYDSRRLHHRSQLSHKTRPASGVASPLVRGHGEVRQVSGGRTKQSTPCIDRQQATGRPSGLSVLLRMRSGIT